MDDKQKTLDELLDDFSNASFDCGAFEVSSNPQSVHDRYSKIYSTYLQARAALKARIEALTAKALDSRLPEMTNCPCCENGEWESECCNGADGCSCHGERVSMGRCHVCGGTGMVRADMQGVDKMANAKTIRSCFTGSGPKTGYWAGK